MCTMPIGNVYNAKWLVLLVAADLQVCSVYSFRTDLSMKRSFTHILIESIAATLKVLVSVCPLVFRRLQYSFKQSTSQTFLLKYAL